MPKSTTSQEKKIEQADKDRIAKQAEETVAQADKERMLATRREGELTRIAGDLPDDNKALWMFVEHSLTQSAVSMIDAGRALIKLKEGLPHGEYEAGLKERGISPRSAHRICASARAFADRSEKFLKLGRTKLYACLDFSNEELDALEDGQSVLDITLDDLDRMTTRELKTLVQKRDADLEIKEQLLESKNKQIDAIATELEKTKGNMLEGEDSPIVQTIKANGMQTAGSIILLRNHADKLAQKGGEADVYEVAALSCVLENLRIELALAFERLEAACPAYQAHLEGAAVDMNSWKSGVDIPTDMKL